MAFDINVWAKAQAKLPTCELGEQTWGDWKAPAGTYVDPSQEVAQASAYSVLSTLIAAPKAYDAAEAAVGVTPEGRGKGKVAWRSSMDLKAAAAKHAKAKGLPSVDDLRKAARKAAAKPVKAAAKTPVATDAPAGSRPAKRAAEAAAKAS